MGGFCAKAPPGSGTETVGQGEKPRTVFRAQSLLDNHLATAEISELAWLNALVGRLWPKILGAVDKMLVEQVKPQIKEKLPKSLRNSFDMTAEFEKQPPAVGPIKVYRTAAAGTTDGPKILIDLEHCPECRITLKLGLLSAGVRLVKLTGACVVSLNPVLDVLPIVHGTDVYCPDVPRFDLDFTGIANIADVPGIARIVRSAIEEAVCNAIVLPHKFAARWSLDEVNHLQIVGSMNSMMVPIGVLRISIVKCSNLHASADWGFSGKSKFDPYVRVRIGNKIFDCELNAEGAPADEKKSTAEFAVFDTTQQLRIDVYDEDNFTKDDHIGHHRPLGLADAFRMTKTPLILTTPRNDSQEAGKLRIDLQWLTAVDSLEDAEGCLVNVAVTQIVVPRSWALEGVGIRVLHNEVATEAACVLVEEAKGPDKAVAEALQRVERSLLQQGISKKVVEKAMQLEDRGSPSVWRVGSDLWFQAKREELVGDLQLAILSASGQKVARSKLPLASVTGKLVFEGKLFFSHLSNAEQAEAAVKVSVSGLHRCKIEN